MFVLTLFVSMFYNMNFSAFAADSQTIFIRADGSIDPIVPEIVTTDSITYIFTDNLSANLVIERDNVVVDGAGYALEGNGSINWGYYGVFLNNTENDTVKNLNVDGFGTGICFFNSSKNLIINNNITNNFRGIGFRGGVNENLDNIITKNRIYNNYHGVYLIGEDEVPTIKNTTVSYNQIFYNDEGISSTSYHAPQMRDHVVIWNNISYNVVAVVEGGFNNLYSNNLVSYNDVGFSCYIYSGQILIRNNDVLENDIGITLSSTNAINVEYNNIQNNTKGIIISSNWGSSTNFILKNLIKTNTYGIETIKSSGNSIYHNNFIENIYPLTEGVPGEDYEYLPDSSNSFDNGYPSGGNYWDDYVDVDIYSGPNQDEPGNDGIWDHPYTLNAENQDTYPLIEPWAPEISIDGTQSWCWTDYTDVEAVCYGDVDDDGQPEIVSGGCFEFGKAQLAVWDADTLAFENVCSWYWGGSTFIRSVAIGDVDADGDTEIITGGHFAVGSQYVAQLCVWNGETLELENVKVWQWTATTHINSIAVVDIDNDGSLEIITGGFYRDGTFANAQLCVWDGATLDLEKVRTWNWGVDTSIFTLSVGDVDSDGSLEVVTGGICASAQLCVWDGATLALENIKMWKWGSLTYINSIAISDVDGDSKLEIVTGGEVYDSSGGKTAQLCSWNGSTLDIENVRTWSWNGGNYLDSVCAGDVNGDGQIEIITGGYFVSGDDWYSQLGVWDGSNLQLIDAESWYCIPETVWLPIRLRIFSICTGDVDGNGAVDIITGGCQSDGSHWNSILCGWVMN